MSVVIFGGGSEIGGHIARKLCVGQEVVLAGRNTSSLRDIEKDLRALGAKNVHLLTFDAKDFTSHREIVHSAQQLAGPIKTAIVAFGILGDQQRAETDEAHAVEIASVDYTAQVSLLTVLADELRAQETPNVIVAFSSIAGWRARRANYVYGSTKAGLDAFCQGLADALHGSMTRLIIARPGFVIGNMTKGMTPAPLSVYPEAVAEAVVKEMGRTNNSSTVWIPKRLKLLAWVMRIVPRPVWRKMPR